MTHPPRILVVSREQWPRALLRAQLAKAGYDAIGSGTLSRALRHAPNDAERGPLRVVVVDGGAVAAEREALAHARRRYPGVAFVLVHRAGAVGCHAAAAGHDRRYRRDRAPAGAAFLG